MADELPYQIAVLCYLYDRYGRLLLLHRRKPPNRDLYSPIGGKLHMRAGESPAACALREIKEEADLDLGHDELRLAGMVSETAYEGDGHWLILLYEVTRPVAIERRDIREGTLEWHGWDELEKLNIPQTDRRVINPLLRRYSGRFFHVHIDCSNGELDWRLEHPAGEMTNDE